VKTLSHLVAATLGFIFLAVPISAQIKATPAGQILPTPRTQDGKPDLTGVYQRSTQRGPWRDPDDNPVLNTGEPAPYQPWAAEKVKEFVARRGIDDPHPLCLPPGVPRSLVGATLFPMQIIQTPQAVLIIYENGITHRYIPLNARHRDDLGPTFDGDSVGHWEGDTLVVDVTNFNDKTWIWGTGTFHTEAMHVVERWTRVDKDQLNYEAIVEDPNVLTKPWQHRHTLMLREGTLLTEYVCAENNLDPGRQQRLLTEDPNYFGK